MTLVWESAGNDEPGDQNADSIAVPAGCTSAYYSLGPDRGGWTVELIGTDHGDEVLAAGFRVAGPVPSENEAKAAAQRYEDEMRI